LVCVGFKAKHNTEDIEQNRGHRERPRRRLKRRGAEFAEKSWIVGDAEEILGPAGGKDAGLRMTMRVAS
jgi:hypothetical protein